MRHPYSSYLGAKFDSCNSLLSSIHTLLVKILRYVRLYIIGLNENIINTVCSGIFGYNIEIKPSLRLGTYNETSSGCRKLDEVKFYSEITQQHFELYCSRTGSFNRGFSITNKYFSIVRFPWGLSPLAPDKLRP